MNVLPTIWYLARHGLPLHRGDDNKNSNFYQLVLLRGENAATVLDRAYLRYTSPDIQIKILTIMVLKVLREILCQLRSSVYTIMIDETTDISNSEQVVLVFHWVDDAINVHEEFVGLYQFKSTDAQALVHLIKDVLLRFNMQLYSCCGQCYDGASATSGTRSGAAKILSDKEPRAVYTYCNGHAINLAVNDTIRQSSVIKSALDIMNEISKLIKKSPTRDAIFCNIKSEMTPETAGFRVLCPTRWTVRALTLQSILDNYEVILQLWATAKEAIKKRI